MHKFTKTVKRLVSRIRYHRDPWYVKVRKNVVRSIKSVIPSYR